MAFANVESPIVVQVEALGWTSVTLSNGAEFADDHPVIAQFPQFFPSRASEAPVEAATASPGEKRSVGKAKPASSAGAATRAKL